MKSAVRSLGVGAALVLCAVGPATSAPPVLKLKDPLIHLGFLVGGWKDGRGEVADTGGTSKGTSRFTITANGWMLLRQDHTDTFDKQGKPAGNFDSVMMIYADGGAVRADYGDGEGHVIHYALTADDPGRLAVFTAPATDNTPGFQLTYQLTTSACPAGDDLIVDFAMLLPGGVRSRPIASGVLSRVECDDPTLWSKHAPRHRPHR